MKDLAKLLHVLLCSKQHEKNQLKLIEESDKCKWYIESNIEDSWKQPDHKKWLDIGFKVTTQSGVEKEEELIELLSEVISVIASLNSVIDKHPNLYEIIMTIISSSLKPRPELETSELPETTG